MTTLFCLFSRRFFLTVGGPFRRFWVSDFLVSVIWVSFLGEEVGVEEQWLARRHPCHYRFHLRILHKKIHPRSTLEFLIRRQKSLVIERLIAHKTELFKAVIVDLTGEKIQWNNNHLKVFPSNRASAYIQESSHTCTYDINKHFEGNSWFYTLL